MSRKVKKRIPFVIRGYISAYVRVDSESINESTVDYESAITEIVGPVGRSKHHPFRLALSMDNQNFWSRPAIMKMTKAGLESSDEGE